MHIPRETLTLFQHRSSSDLLFQQNLLLANHPVFLGQINSCAPEAAVQLAQILDQRQRYGCHAEQDHTAIGY